MFSNLVFCSQRGQQHEGPFPPPSALPPVGCISLDDPRALIPPAGGFDRAQISERFQKFGRADFRLKTQSACTERAVLLREVT